MKIPLSGTRFDLVHGDYSASIASVGATLRTLRHGGRDLIVPFAANEVRPAYRGAILAPWPNRVVDGRYSFAGAKHQLSLTEPQRLHALLSAHEAIEAEQDVWGSITQLAAEYETIAAGAQYDRWSALVRASGLPEADAEDAIASDAFGPLTAELRRAEVNHHDMDTLLPRLVAARGFTDADDIAAVLHARVARATARPAGAGRARRAPRMIAGLIPVVTGAMSADMREALDERRDLIEQRSITLVDATLFTHEAWIDVMGERPRSPRQAEAWRQQVPNGSGRACRCARVFRCVGCRAYSGR